MCYYNILSILTVFSVVPKLSYNSTVASEYYLGEPLTVRCEPSNIPKTGLFILALRIEDKFQIQCQRVGGAWELAQVESPPAGATFTPLKKEDCNLPENDKTMSVNFNITEGLENLNITCHDLDTGKKSNSSLLIKETKCEYLRANNWN